jgi:hypothetical protein
LRTIRNKANARVTTSNECQDQLRLPRARVARSEDVVVTVKVNRKAGSRQLHRLVRPRGVHEVTTIFESYCHVPRTRFTMSQPS